MDYDLKRKASGRTLEILQNMWKSDCEKDEKKSLDKWRYKEIWLLDTETMLLKKRNRNKKEKSHTKEMNTRDKK